MTTTAGGAVRVNGRPRRRQNPNSGQARAGVFFATPYLLLLTGFALIPAVYTVYLAFMSPTGGFAGFDTFVQVFNDYRFLRAFANLGLYALLFLIPTMIISIGLAVLLQSRAPRVAATFRTLYYLPHAVVGVAGVLLWMFLLTPRISPIGGFLEWLGFSGFYDIVRPDSPASLAALFALIAVWTSGQGILLMFAALSSVPEEVEEAAAIDGANGWQVFWHIKLPILRKWIAYLLIISVASATQLFAEPQLMVAVTNGAVGNNFSPLQLAYTYAYQYGNFPGAAAISLVLLVIGLAAAALVVRTTGLFKIEI
ncbi:carbohydrate ABC transporter permease [Microbacterium sp. ZW CA_36]|jgi:multiple sugar transport system permease protein|uniref:carbohydrate ABC transporter permease n=1 Tax=Microbacterium sp. ZW CA_36 TaxID=3378078 RepID=UPI003854FDD6